MEHEKCLEIMFHRDAQDEPTLLNRTGPSMRKPSWVSSGGPHFNLPLKLTISEKRFADAEKVNGLRYAKQRGDDHHAAKRALQKGPRSLLAHNLLETIQNSLVRVLTGSAGQNLITKESSENFSLF